MGIMAFLGAKSSRKQFGLCAKSDNAERITIPRDAVILSLKFFIDYQCMSV
jgi:hypothetical protein